MRHGESEANAGLATTSADAIALTERGENQAAKVAESFPIIPTLVIVSPYLRARQTADPLIRRFPTAEVEEWPVEELTYLSIDGTTTAADRRPRVIEYWNRSDPNYHDGPGAESFTDFIDRSINTLNGLRLSEHRSIAVFTHGQFIRALMWLVLTGRKIIDPAAMAEFGSFLAAVPFPNTAVVRFSVSGGEWSIGSILTEPL